jgi:hypothetical protein
MYVFPTMINLGFRHDEKPVWPSKAHKLVAQNVGLCNPRVTDRDTLIAIVDAVNKVPMDRIKLVDYRTLIQEFGCPDVG